MKKAFLADIFVENEVHWLLGCCLRTYNYSGTFEVEQTGLGGNWVLEPNCPPNWQYLDHFGTDSLFSLFFNPKNGIRVSTLF